MSSTIRALPEYRCIVAILEGKLCTCKIGAQGDLDFFAGQLNWEKVRHPADQNFLRAASDALKIEITDDHLEGGRPWKK